MKCFPVHFRSISGHFRICLGVLSAFFLETFSRFLGIESNGFVENFYCKKIVSLCPVFFENRKLDTFSEKKSEIYQSTERPHL